MDKQTLIRYLEDVVELEKQVFLQQQTLDGIDNRMRSLGIAKPVGSLPMKRELTYTSNHKYMATLIAFVVGAIVAVILTIAEDAANDDKSGFGYYFLGMLFLGGIAALITFFIEAAVVSNRDKAMSKSISQTDYEKRVALHKTEQHLDTERVNRELAEKRILEQERSALYQKHLQTKQVLQSYYDLDIIYGKYRNFVAVSSFVDYFKSGRCSTLGENTGGDGAYNTFETEIRLDRIIDKLDVVISMLSQIKSNQWCIYNAIQEGNSISSRLVESTNRLAESSAKTAQYAGITAANSAIAAYNAQQAANEAEQLRKLKQYELGIRSTRY